MPSSKTYPKIFGYGFLIFVVAMILLFVMSSITGSTQPIGSCWVGAIIAVLMTVVSWGFSRVIKPKSNEEALVLGIIWAVMLAAILLIIAIPNQTTSVVFGQKSIYLVFIGVALGPVIGRWIKGKK